uniref:Uncharacterized protein n=1 Tax=Sphaerodactylus townsendi TaxID=933632 RepID=A0ACB8GD10_9SAUR
MSAWLMAKNLAQFHLESKRGSVRSPSCLQHDVWPKPEIGKVLTYVAPQMLCQYVNDAGSANQQHHKNIAEERRHHEKEQCRYKVMLEESRLERKAFQDAMDRTMAVTMTGVNAIKLMSEKLMSRPTVETSQTRSITSKPENALSDIICCRPYNRDLFVCA